MNPEQLRRAIKLDTELSDRLSQQGFQQYLDRVIIDSRPEPKRFGSVCEWWQKLKVDAVLPAIEYVTGYRNHYDGPLNFYFELAKGGDKSGFAARILNWVLGYSRKKIKAYAAAADTDQARLIRDAMFRERELNTFLRRRVQILLKAAWGRGGQLEILAADAASSHGKTPDLLIIDEFTHIHSREFFDALYSARNKRPSCVTIIQSNAGVKGSYQWELREIARTTPSRWFFYAQPEYTHLASWMNEAAIAEDAKLLTKTEADRLLFNRWIDPGEESGFCLLDEAMACRTGGVGEGCSRSRYFAAVDYGPRRDRTALSLVRRDGDSEPLALADLKCWHRPGGEVQIEEVERWIEATHAAHPQTVFVFDEYQMLSTIQKYEKAGYRIERFAPRGGAANYEMAANLRSLIASRRIRWAESIGPTPPHTNSPLPGATSFEDELSQLLLRVTPSGYRFDHKSGKHDDRAVAVGMAALFAVSAPPLAEFAPPEPLPRRDFDFKAPPRRQIFGVR